MSMGNIESQRIPVKVYRSDERLTVAAPMPGMEPQDIVVTLSQDGKLTLSGELRGEFKGDKDVIQDEWNPGPYRRAVELSTPVDGTSANATYNNGVLVVSLPTSDSVRPANIELERLDSTTGRREGVSGHPSA
jgi:HSP20 family protein